ncbi:MAG: tetratricopeptide repeat protein [Planctomycetes bacterium]|nr:tetratricopeptide repeat protein [Planctomycetota bacterium]
MARTLSAGIAVLLLLGAPAALQAADADDHFRRGLAAEQAGRGREAMEEYRLARRADPDHAEAAFHLGALADQLDGDTDLFLDLLSVALRQAPDNPEHRAARAAVYLRFANDENALTDLNVAVRSDPANPAHRRARMEVAFRLGAWDAVVADSDVLLRAGPDPALLARQGRALHETGRHVEALETLAALLAERPDDDGSRRLLAASFAALGLHDRAEAELTGIIDAGRGVAGDFIARAASRAAPAPGRAGVRDAPGALADLERARVAAPDSFTVAREIARVTALAGDAGSALALWNRVAERWPGAPVEEERATAAMAAGRYEEAARAFAAVARVAPARPDLLISLATARFAGGDAAGAVEAAERAVALAPEDPRLRLLAYAFQAHSGRRLAAQAELFTFRGEYAGPRQHWAALAINLMLGDGVLPADLVRERERNLRRPLSGTERADLTADFFSDYARAREERTRADWAGLAPFYLGEWMLSEADRARARSDWRVERECLAAAASHFEVVRRLWAAAATRPLPETYIGVEALRRQRDRDPGTGRVGGRQETKEGRVSPSLLVPVLGRLAPRPPRMRRRRR